MQNKTESTFSFSREHRLAAAEIKKVLRNGKRFRVESLVLVVLRTNNLQTKVAFSCSRKVGSAVTRNRLKRWLREAFRLNKPLFLKGFSAVIIVRPAQSIRSLPQIENDLLVLFKQAGLLKK